MDKLKTLRWVGSSRTDLKKFPPIVQDRIGFALYQVQKGVFPCHAKPLKGLNGVFEIVCNFDKNAYRSIYATKLDNHIYVLHVFQKKSTLGIKTPKHEIELIKTRFHTAKLISTGDL